MVEGITNYALEIVFVYTHTHLDLLSLPLISSKVTFSPAFTKTTISLSVHEGPRPFRLLAEVGASDVKLACDSSDM